MPFVDTEDADIAHMVVAAGIHAAGDIKAEVAQVVQVIHVVKAPLNRFGNGDGFGVGQRTEVAARAADHIGESADIGRGESASPGFLPELG